MLATLAHGVHAADWPMWRADARRSGTTTESLPHPLHLQWSAQQPAPRPAWPEDPRLHFDGSLEPIVVGKTMVVASSRNDSVTAMDTETGEKRWQFFADAPIRFAPVAHQGRVYFGGDDGCLYCVESDDGKLIWKFEAAPANRRVLGNERVSSAWPIRGGPVLLDNQLFFTSGIWPFEGTQLMSVKVGAAESSDGSATMATRPIMLPEKVTPQGYLATDNGKVLIPSGRDTAAAMDVATGKFVGLSYQSRGKTDYHVTSEGDYLLHGDRIYDIQGKQLLANVAHRPITTREAVYGTWDGNLVAYDLANPKSVEKKDRRGKTHIEKTLTSRWSVSKETIAAATNQPQDAPLALEVKAGDRLYGFHGRSVFAVDVTDQQPKISWHGDIEGTPCRLIAADERLFVVTREGFIHCFGGEAVDAPLVHKLEATELAVTKDAKRVTQWLDAMDDPSGYCLVVGATEEIVDEIIRQSNMHVLVLDPNAESINRLRRRYDAMGLYGTRVAALDETPRSANLPPYGMSLIVSDTTEDWAREPAALQHMHRCLHPYGGRAFLKLADTEAAALAKEVGEDAQLEAAGEFTRVTRAGGLAGAADWTHEYGDRSNSLMSHDELVKAPLGVLWFGGPAAASELFFNRHYWPPSLTVSRGRMFFQGPEVFVAVDIYTGRVLWKKKLPAGSSPGRRGNFFEKVRVGFHFLAADDAVYLSDGSQCEKLAPATGKTLATFKLKQPQGRWGTMRLWEDRLICTVFLPDEKDEYHPKEVVSIDRHTGQQVWKHDAKFTVPVAALGDDRVFLYDGVLAGLYDAWKRRGLVPKSNEAGYLKALDIRTGKQVWESGTARAVTWLGASTDTGVLVASNQKGIEGWDAKSGQPLWEKEQEGKGFYGHPEELWDKVILWKDRILDQRGPGLAYDIKTGNPLTTDHPLTGEEVPWEFTKTGHHCSYAIASPHMMTFRADTAGFLDLASGTTGRLNGFRSGCRNSLIPAGGVLNVPNFAHGCVCSYSLFTSLALVHTPDADVWTYNAFKSPGDTIERVGVNLGAPGDREDTDGTLWLDHPSVGGPSPKVDVKVVGSNVTYFRGHSLTLQGEELPWVAASGCEGLSELQLGLRHRQGKKCRIKLLFAEPSSDIAAGERVFDVSINNQMVLEGFDVRQQAGAARHVVSRVVESTAVDGNIVIKFTSRVGKPILCGVEVVVLD